MNDERAIIKSAQEGDESAFTEIVKRHQRNVHMLALRLVGDEQEALDISQQAFIQAYRGIKNFRGDSKLSTWLYRITYNIAIRRMRSSYWKRMLSMDEKAFIEYSGSDGVEAESERKEFRSEVQKAVEKLPPKMRAVFTMHQIQGLKLAEIAEITGKSVGNIKSLHYHSIRKMREALKEWRYTKFH